MSHVCYESMRHYFSLSERLNQVLHRPKERLDLEVWCILLAGACQIEHSRVPRHAVVSNAVDATRKIGKSSASSMVNAVLRKYPAESPLQSEEAVSELPNWLLRRIDQHYSNEKEALIEALKTRAPLTVRVNSSIISREEFCQSLDAEDIAYSQPPMANAVTLNQPRTAVSIPGYDKQHFGVQDLASQLAVPLLEPDSSDRILDACAAPGIKTAQILDLFPQNTVQSIDVKPERSTWNIMPNAQLNPRHAVCQADLKDTRWWDGNPFQRILLDVPCSGVGTLRRHPDIKAIRTEEQLDNLTKLQQSLLSSVWKTLATGGRLVYSTCSFLPEENDMIVEDFMSQHPDASVDPFTLPYGSATKVGHQIMPAVGGCDGFYYSRLQKSEEVSCTS